MQGSAQLIVPNRILLSGCEAGDAVRLRYRLSAVHFGDSLSTRALTFSLVDCGSEGASAVVVSATPVTLEGVIELRTPKDSPTGPAFRVELRLRGRNVAFTEVFALVAPRTSTSLTSTSLTAEMADLTSLASATPFRAGELVDVRIGSEWQAGLVIKCAEDGDVVVVRGERERAKGMWWSWWQSHLPTRSFTRTRSCFARRRSSALAPPRRTRNVGA